MSQKEIFSSPIRQRTVRKTKGESAPYILPDTGLLCEGDTEKEEQKDQHLRTQQIIIDTLCRFKLHVIAGTISCGPSMTRYEIEPSRGVRISKIAARAHDLALATQAESLEITAPLPGKSTIGIDVANRERKVVAMRSLLETEEFRLFTRRIPLLLGEDLEGRPLMGDLAAMHHVLVAGTTGSGKSVCINCMIVSMLYRFRPDELQLILIDPGETVMLPYRRLPHLLLPTATHVCKALGALRRAVVEMERRYEMFARAGVSNFQAFNDRSKLEEGTKLAGDRSLDDDLVESIVRELEEQGEQTEPFDDEEEQAKFSFADGRSLPDRIPYLVIIIDAFSDLMTNDNNELETCMVRLTQKGHLAGIHLIVATQTPRSDVVTGMIKANIPSRIAFQVSSALDSRIILDSPGAEKLVGKGDLLYLPPGSSKLERAQGAFIDDKEVEAVVAHCASQADQDFHEEVQQAVENGGDAENPGSGGLDPEDAELLQKCIEAVIIERKASTSFLQRRLRIGYGRASRMLELMEQRGIVSPADGANRPREVLVE